MNRDKIKIIEFGKEEESPPQPDSARDATIKIVEFDNDPADSPKRVATAKDIGHIKIIEFDDDPKTKASSAPEQRAARVGPVSIKEFDKDAEVDEPTGRPPKIKIMEFD